MNRREFIFGSASLAMMPFSSCNSDIALSEADIDKIQDIVKCRNDIVYFAEKHIKIASVQNGLVNIKLEDWQKKYLMHLATGKTAVLSAYRQSGKTTLNLIYATWKTVFTSCQKVTFVTCNKRMSEHCFNAVHSMFEFLPEWMKARDYKNEHYMRDKKHIVMKNCSEIVVTYANADFRGYMPGNILMLDEYAFFTNEQNTNVMNMIPVTTSCKNHQVILASTPFIANDAFGIFIRYLKEHGKTSSVFEIAKS